MDYVKFECTDLIKYDLTPTSGIIIFIYRDIKLTQSCTRNLM